MRRRDFLGALAGAAFARQNPADFTLEIGPVTVELAPGTNVKTIGYNGSAPGPLLRIPEGKLITIEVHNNTGSEEVVHWHGLHIPSDVDGSLEEGTPGVPAGGRRRYGFTAAPSGTRWYHSHVMAMRNLKRATYTGQFGFLYVEPKNDPGAYDQEVFLA
ncbi:MAG TPA: multicopper oxidase domain-containing protein, partial [Bryobacteraceae bacterium]|nr:multicopper oxidase domain-containing protein [Bryobacteraceae bacterium]